MENKPKKQVAVDGRLSHAKDLSVSQVKLLLNLLLRFFTEQAKGFAKKRPKGSDPNELLNQIQKDTPNPDWSQTKIAKYIQRLNKLKDAKAAQGDTKGLSDGTKKIVELLDEICKLFPPLEKGFKTASKKPAKVVIKKKPGRPPKANEEADTSTQASRLQHIIEVIGVMAMKGGQKITAETISEELRDRKTDAGKNSNASVRACLRQHRSNCKKDGKPILVDCKPTTDCHEYFLTEEGNTFWHSVIMR
ncbi:MAG: hypothetical protein WC836_00255 [Desulfobacula sp.]|jgi:hypothetical protein